MDVSKGMDSVLSASSSKASPSATAPPKPLTILEYDEAESSSPDLYTDLWGRLEQAVSEILADKKSFLKFEQMYTYVNELCNHNLQDRLFESLQSHIQDYLSHEIQPLFRDFFAEDGVSKIDITWRTFQRKMIEVSKIFTPLDRGYVLHNSSSISIINASFNTFSKELTKNPEFMKTLISRILGLIDDIRQWRSVDTDILASILRMLIDLQLYSKYFEPPFLEVTKTFYTRAGQCDLEQAIEHYLAKVATRIKLEETQISPLISQSTTQKLSQIVKHECFGRFFPSNLQSGVFKLLDNSKEQELRLLNELVHQVRNGEKDLTLTLSGYVRVSFFGNQTRVQDVMSRNPSPPGFEAGVIEALIVFQTNLHDFILPWFDNRAITKNVSMVFDSALNMAPTKFSEYLCLYIDTKLRRFETQQDTQFSEFLNHAITLLKCVHQKEAFIQKYQILLAERLLNSKVSSVENENQLLEHIKTEIGIELTFKLDGMIRDIYASRELSFNFNKGRVDSRLESSLILLSQCLWPSYTYSKINIPAIISEKREAYTSFYLTKEKANRELDWPLSLSTCILSVEFDKGTKELEVFFLEALVLCLFTDTNCLTISDIIERLGVTSQTDTEELSATVQSLCCGNYCILLKDPPGLSVLPTDRLTFHSAFRHNSFRIKVPRFSSPAQSPDLARVNQPDYFERGLQIDSLIVGHMKKMKRMTHDSIILTVVHGIRSSLTETDVIDRIDSLISREYIRKDSNDPSVYTYCE